MSTVISRLLNLWIAFIFIAGAILGPILLIHALMTRHRLVEVAAYGSMFPFIIDSKHGSEGYEYWYPWPQSHDTRVYKFTAPIKITETVWPAPQRRSFWINSSKPQEVYLEPFVSGQRVGIEGHLIDEAANEKGNSVGENPTAPYAYAYPLPDGKINWHRGTDYLSAEGNRGTIQRCFVDSGTPSQSMLEKPKITFLIFATIFYSIPFGLFVCGRLGFGPLGFLR